MVFSLCDVGPAGRLHPWDGAGPAFSTSATGIRHESYEDESARATLLLKEVVVREGIRVSEVSNGAETVGAVWKTYAEVRTMRPSLSFGSDVPDNSPRKPG
jgi:hypothetical protein